jgi:hypothetical protein
MLCSMRRTRAILGFAALLAAALAVTAQAPPKREPAGAEAKSSAHATPAKGPRRATTVRGEILDMSCYVARGLRGEVHRECGLKCVASGVCMGIIGADSMLYMLTLDHARAMAPSTFTTPDPLDQCKQWVGLTVEVSGGAHQRDGMCILEVMRAKLIPAPAPGGPK